MSNVNAEIKPAPPSAVARRDRWLDSWHVNPTLDKGYDAIDGLRGIAILMVVACHTLYFNPAASEKVKLVGGFIGAGYWGVTLFFTLSGFLIAHPFWKRKIRGDAQITPPGYARRRFWKIYPPLALSVVLLTPVYMARNSDPSYIGLAAQWLIGWPWIVPVSSNLNPVMWSLVVEVHFYLVLPLLFIVFKRASAEKTLWLMFFTLLLGPPLYRWWGFTQGAFFILHPTICTFFPSLLDSFAFGVLLAGLENVRRTKKSWARLGDLGFVLFIAAMAATSWVELHQIGPRHIEQEILGWLVKIASGCLLLYIADPAHPRSRLLSAPWLRWCGLISYEWYLIHQPIILWARESIGPAEGNIGKYFVIVVGSFLTAVSIAAVVYRWISLPILKKGRDPKRA